MADPTKELDWMSSLSFARFALKHPIAVLVAWAAALLVALAFADSARDSIQESDLQIPGTAAERTAKLSQSKFGSTISMAILLSGPSSELQRQGPRLVRRLQQIKGVEVLSPWDISGQRVLREPSGQALLTLQVRLPFEDIAARTTTSVERELRRSLQPPVEAHLSGLAPLMKALNKASLDSLAQGELVALPLLFILLLLVFRSPVAALIPALAGFIATRVGTAVMAGVAASIEVDALALNMVTMIGLALGVDYSLLIVSRFRDELASGRSTEAAIEEAVTRAGRTVIFAGSALAFGMIGALLIAPGALLVSSTLGVIVATLIAVLIGLTAIPASLVLVGPAINRWQLASGRKKNPWLSLAKRALRKPGIAAFAVVVPLLLLAAPLSTLETGPPSVKNLPPSESARQDFESFERLRGSGWATPFEVIFTAKEPLTSTADLNSIGRFERSAGRLEGVDQVLGPSQLAPYSSELRRLVDQLSARSRRKQRASDGGEVVGGILVRPQTKTNISFSVNTANGGDALRVMVIPKGAISDGATVALRPELEARARSAARQLGASAVVGGPAVLLDDFDRSTTARFPYLVMILVLITFLVLLVVFRLPILALIAVALNLLTVGAAVGVMVLVFQFDPSILGGPGYLDAIALSGIFAIIFGLSIDYEVFLISRLLEGYHKTASSDGAIAYGLEKTARVITGAAAIMAGVFIAFALSPVANTRQFGVGLTVAVALDATVVRLILLPALIKLCGDRVWKTPAWLERILPR